MKADEMKLSPEWIAPDFEEIPLSAEIVSYASAELDGDRE